MAALEKKGALLQRQEKELALKIRTLNEVRHFMDRAAALGLEREKWTYYDVNVQEPVSFAEMEEILNQCNNSAAAFYRPISLHIKKTTSESVDTAQRVSSRSANARSGAEADLLITLSGKFLARPK